MDQLNSIFVFSLFYGVEYTVKNRKIVTINMAISTLNPLTTTTLNMLIYRKVLK